ncbi:hypothetical protein CJF42_00275 [Pseudoalteromonas sp. NBT06-2]|nr:hypothetical protein CJF42_00275 [Pseudoalteromonas sp. NBT06-2]
MELILLKAFFLSLFILSISSFANEAEVLTVDRVISNTVEFAFDNDKNEKPKQSDFELRNYIIMSNELGERWALLTVKNQATGNRILERTHLLALFANGERSNPTALKLNFTANEMKTVTVSFGENKFPILSISSGFN